MSRHVLSSALGAVLLVVAGCDGDDRMTPTATDPPATSEVSTGSGLVLAGSGWYDSGQMVVDASGIVWLGGPGQITRLDPATGEATTWDATDDFAFAPYALIATSADGGVWIIDRENARLFDGDRFVVEAPLPDVLHDDGLAAASGDGDALWVAGWSGNLVRWADGEWARPIEGHGGPLALAADGSLWAADCRWVEESVTCDLAYSDGTGWHSPGDPAHAPDEEILSMVGDADGGMWVLTRRALSHFDGTTWTPFDLRGLGELGGRSPLALAADGSVWVGGSTAVGRLGTDGEWATYGADGDLSAGQRNVAAAGDVIVVTTGDGAFRFTGDGFERLWIDPAATPAGWVRGAPLAVSRDEVWVAVDDGSATVWMRYRGGVWSPMGPGMTHFEGASRAVLASDGTVWATTPAGLVRFEGDAWTVISATATPPLAAGADGVVWAVDGTYESGLAVVGFTPDGTRTDRGYPNDPDFPKFYPMALAVGTEGSLWLASGGYAPFALARWTGSWEVIALHGEVDSTTDMAVAGDGALWVTVGDGDSYSLSRYFEGEWTSIVDGWMADLATSPDGDVCGVFEFEFVCFDATGETGRTPVPDWVTVDIAPDEAIWLLGQQLFRLPDGTLAELTG